MSNPNHRNFPAMIIYTVDCEETAEQTTNQTVVYQREDNHIEVEVEAWPDSMDVHVDPSATFASD
jgi:hypothetical protein